MLQTPWLVATVNLTTGYMNHLIVLNKYLLLLLLTHFITLGGYVLFKFDRCHFDINSLRAEQTDRHVLCVCIYSIAETD